MLQLQTTRSGNFICGWELAPDKCGLNPDLPDTHKFEYTVTVGVSKLDKHGFVIDNRDIARYFKDTYENAQGVYVSCEVMALDAVAFFRRVIDHDGQGRRCLLCDVSVSGFAGAVTRIIFRDDTPNGMKLVSYSE